MKPFLPAVAALVVGIVLGAWQPRGELLAARAELDAARNAKGDCKGGAAASLRSILHADTPDLEVGTPKKRVRNVAPVEEPAEPEVPDAAPVEPVEPPADATGPESPEQLREAMHTAMEARRAQAREALVEAGIEDEQMAAVDAAMDQMNQELATEVQGFVDEAAKDGEVDRREVMEFAAEALDIVLAADERVRAVVPEDVYAAVDDAAVDPFSYVSGSTLDPLTRLEGIEAPVFGR